VRVDKPVRVSLMDSQLFSSSFTKTHNKISTNVPAYT